MTPFTLTTTKQTLSKLLTEAGYSETALVKDGTLSLTIFNNGDETVYITTVQNEYTKPNAGNGAELGIGLQPKTSTTIELRNVNLVELSATATTMAVQILAI